MNTSTIRGSLPVHQLYAVIYVVSYTVRFESGLENGEKQMLGELSRRRNSVFFFLFLDEAIFYTRDWQFFSCFSVVSSN